MNLQFGLLSLLSAQWLVDLVIAGEKAKGGSLAPAWSRLAAHGAAHGVAFYLLYGDLLAWPLALWIVFSHTVLDAVEDRLGLEGLGWFLAGQAAHLIVSIAGALLIVEVAGAGLGAGWLERLGAGAVGIQVVLVGVLAATYLGAEMVGGLVAPLQAQFEARPDRPVTAQGDRSDRPDRGFAEGGRLIGLLERALIFLLVLVDQTAAIGFLVAAKSIFRFGELRQRANRLEAEYILIGTLASFLWGLALALLVKYLLALP